MTSTPTLTSADSLARLTDAETTAASASRVLRTFAAHPPQCIPRTSSMTTSSSHRTLTSPLCPSFVEKDAVADALSREASPPPPPPPWPNRGPIPPPLPPPHRSNAT